ncbi:DUF1810 domain-containing protein [Leptolyngbya ohadii]|uniref:DUF1810 domain-containing protein n=1 Tax=Leptolyngbya ohadii TaxID=1962290 RepID=UPI000B59FB6B|nr:DUF1810 domain-containing protein [Leptolyngbya ohadii]
MVNEVDNTVNQNSDNLPDLHNLNRFLQAQEEDFTRALAEVKQGQKQTHWMWYIFPQLEGLGYSSNARYYGIKTLAEARAYLEHPILGLRLIEITEAVLKVEGRSAYDIFGSPDDRKLQSCATLFAAVSPVGSVFDRLLDQYFDGEHDSKTLRLLAD